MFKPGDELAIYSECFPLWDRLQAPFEPTQNKQLQNG